MNKYEKYKQELHRQIAYREIDEFDLIDTIIELHKKIDKQEQMINLLKKGIKR